MYTYIWSIKLKVKTALSLTLNLLICPIIISTSLLVIQIPQQWSRKNELMFSLIECLSAVLGKECSLPISFLAVHFQYLSWLLACTWVCIFGGQYFGSECIEINS